MYIEVISFSRIIFEVQSEIFVVIQKEIIFNHHGNNMYNELSLRWTPSVVALAVHFERCPP